MASYNELTFTAITIDDFRYSPSLPNSCDVCSRGTEPFMRYTLCVLSVGLDPGMQQDGFCCKDCVPGLVLQIVQETERNIEIASNRPNDFDYRDAELDEANEKRYLRDFKEYEQDMTTLRLAVITPALLLYSFKGNKSAVCKRCGGTPLLMYVWHCRKSLEQGLLCHSCAFNLCGTILGSCIENDAEAGRQEEAEANENA